MVSNRTLRLYWRSLRRQLQEARIAETVATVNLRSLAASRTLVLLNGRRQTYLPAWLAGGRFVDVNAFPAVATDRIDVLEEGAG